MADEPTLIELDARNRASLGKLARHRRYLAKLQPDGTIVLTPAAVVPLDTARVKVAFCNWCPDPEKPSPDFHPDGQPEHVEDVPVRREHPTHALDSDLRRLGVSDVGRYFVTGPLGAPPGAAEKLPTVDQWPDGTGAMAPERQCDRCKRVTTTLVAHGDQCGARRGDGWACNGTLRPLGGGS